MSYSYIYTTHFSVTKYNLLNVLTESDPHKFSFILIFIYIESTIFYFSEIKF